MTSDPEGGTDPCAFCSIARGDDTSVEVLCESENWIAFFPLTPATPGHTLVTPRLHVPDLWRVDAPLAADLMAAVVQVGRAIEHATTAEGMNLITSSGDAAEQTVFHLHLHVVPRWREDGFGEIWPPKTQLRGIDVHGVADRIRQECGSSR